MLLCDFFKWFLHRSTSDRRDCFSAASRTCRCDWTLTKYTKRVYKSVLAYFSLSSLTPTLSSGLWEDYRPKSIFSKTLCKNQVHIYRYYTLFYFYTFIGIKIFEKKSFAWTRKVSILFFFRMVETKFLYD